MFFESMRLDNQMHQTAMTLKVQNVALDVIAFLMLSEINRLKFQVSDLFAKILICIIPSKH